MTESLPRTYLINDMARIFSASPVTIRFWTATERRERRGRFILPISEPHQRLRWLVSDVENFLRARSQTTPPIDTTTGSSPAKRLKQESKDYQMRQRLAAETLQKHRLSRSK